MSLSDCMTNLQPQAHIPSTSNVITMTKRPTTPKKTVPPKRAKKYHDTDLKIQRTVSSSSFADSRSPKAEVHLTIDILASIAASKTPLPVNSLTSTDIDESSTDDRILEERTATTRTKNTSSARSLRHPQIEDLAQIATSALQGLTSSDATLTTSTSSSSQSPFSSVQQNREFGNKRSHQSSKTKKVPKSPVKGISSATSSIHPIGSLTGGIDTNPYSIVSPINPHLYFPHYVNPLMGLYPYQNPVGSTASGSSSSSTVSSITTKNCLASIKTEPTAGSSLTSVVFSVAPKTGSSLSRITSVTGSSLSSAVPTATITTSVASLSPSSSSAPTGIGMSQPLPSSGAAASLLSASSSASCKSSTKKIGIIKKPFEKALTYEGEVKVVVSRYNKSRTVGEGQGKITYTDGTIYEGPCKQSRPNGVGLMKYSDGTTKKVYFDEEGKFFGFIQ